DDAVEIARVRLAHAQEQERAGNGEDGLHEEAEVVHRKWIGPADERPLEREVETKGEILGLGRNKFQDEGELTEDEAGARHAGPEPQAVEQAAISGMQEAPEEIRRLPEDEREGHHGLVAVAIEQAAPGRQGERAAEGGERGKEADVEGREVE